MVTLVILEILLVSFQVVSSCQVYPSEYAYLEGSVYNKDWQSANCRNYPQRYDYHSLNTRDYIHCNGSQLRLADSDLGSEQYNSSDYYVWSAGSSRSQLLFIFPTRVNLTTITLHYYSDNLRGLPRLRFYAVPDDFNVWDAPSVSYSYVYITSVPPAGEPAGQRNVSVNFNFISRKILMYKFSNSYAFALSEVQFLKHSYKTTNAIERVTTTGHSHDIYVETTTSDSTTDRLKDMPLMKQTSSTLAATTGSNHESSQDQYDSTSDIQCQGANSTSGWALFGVVTVLFIVSFTINVTIVGLWVYKKRKVKGQTDRPSDFEIEGNPCYEATQVKQTTEETETHLYETVQGRRGK